MEILFLLIPMSVLLVLAIGALFWWSVRSGQFDDLEGPAHRILADDDSADASAPSPPEQGAEQGEKTETTDARLTSVNPASKRHR